MPLDHSRMGTVPMSPLVWLNGLEPPTPRSRTGCSANLSYNQVNTAGEPAECASRSEDP